MKLINKFHILKINTALIQWNHYFKHIFKCYGIFSNAIKIAKCIPRSKL